ncbi:MAG: glycosyltransferase family 4 protein [Ginsengibacter sp.]
MPPSLLRFTFRQMSSKEILFLKSGGFSNINNNVREFLKREYPDYHIETIDVWDFLKHKIKKYHFFINIYFFLTEYGVELMSGQKKLRELFQWFFATSYLSLLVSKEIKRLKKGKDYKFTFQTQSLFNGKMENIPNFIYTDHTTKTNLLYPHINPTQYIRSKRFIEKCETKAYQDATLIFTFGSLPAHSLVTQYQIPKEKVLPVFSGSNIAHPSQSNPQKYLSKNILFVGVEWERKGGPTLLKAFENILKSHPDASLTIVGCKPKNITLVNCSVIGKIPVEEISKYYESASIFCLPTVREPFGIVFIEAMNYGLPIITNNIGCISDMIVNDYNGYLLNNNINDYTEAICKLLNNPDKCREMGENGYQYTQSNFTWEVVGKRIEQNITKALGDENHQV